MTLFINLDIVRPEITTYSGTSEKYNFDFISTVFKLIQLNFCLAKYKDFWRVSISDL